MWPNWLSPNHKCFGMPPLFEPQAGRVIREPLSPGDGYWAGAPTVQCDPRDRRFLLFYRLRQPRPVRGGECRIAESREGWEFTDVWAAKSSDFDSPSIEKCSVFRGLDGRFRLYASYVDGETNRWRVDVLEADRPEGLDPRTRVKILTADEIGAEGVKDPWVMVVGGVYYMLLSYAPILQAASAEERESMHATGDVYNTGVTTSETGLATSLDGVHFTWRGNLMRPGAGWDRYCARLGSLLYVPPVWFGFYDGSASVEGNYEERAGLAVSTDLCTFTSLTPDGPWTTSGGGSGSVRYIDVLQDGPRFLFYYEFAREDGSHDLRVCEVARF